MANSASQLSTLAVIPARGGSKRIPRKNIRPFLGVPMLARTVAMLAESEIFDRIIVSTDDDEVAEVALRAGAEVPFRRPPALSSDTAATLPVVAHAIGETEAGGGRADHVCCVYPAAVLSLPSDLRKALVLVRSPGVDYVFAAATFGYPIQRALRRTPEGGCEMMWPQHRDTRSQDLESAYHDAGQFYFGTRDAWMTGAPIFGARSRLLELPRARVQDIDVPEDWERAEMIFRILHRDEPGG